MAAAPLSVLDLVPVTSGGTAAEALRNSIDLARHAERLGYARYWFAEHHLNPGAAGTSPAVVLALTAAATSAIRRKIPRQPGDRAGGRRRILGGRSDGCRQADHHHDYPRPR